MNETMIFNHNKMVSQGDIVWHLGDFYMGRDGRAQEYFNRLNGEKHLIIGNHDQVGITLEGWKSISDLKEILVDGQRIILCHYAMKVWNKSHKGAIQLYGHSHGNLEGNSQQLDVGVDCWDYYPITLKEIKKKLKTLPEYKLVDHHGEK